MDPEVKAAAAMIADDADPLGKCADGRPVGFDVEDDKSRNVVERAFNRLKNCRGLATRYDKHALVY